MQALKPRLSKEEFAHRGQLVYARDVQPRLTDDDDGKFAAVDIESGAFEIDGDDFAATERLLSRCPNAQIWLVRVGRRAAYRVGRQPRAAAE